MAGLKGAAGTRDRDVRRGALAHLPRGYWRRAMLQEPFSCSVYRMPDAGYCVLYAVCCMLWVLAKRPGQPKGLAMSHEPRPCRLMIRVSQPPLKQLKQLHTTLSRAVWSVWLLPKFESACICIWRLNEYERNGPGLFQNITTLELYELYEPNIQTCVRVNAENYGEVVADTNTQSQGLLRSICIPEPRTGP